MQPNTSIQKRMWPRLFSVIPSLWSVKDFSVRKIHNTKRTDSGMDTRYRNICHEFNTLHDNRILFRLYSTFGKSLCTCKRCWKWCPRAIQAWTRLILFANTFCRSAFGKSLCTYKRRRKWCTRASIQALNKSMYRSLSAQRLSERTVYSAEMLSVHPALP
jgi:hypothetical protein